MRLVAISDACIPAAFMESGLEPLRNEGLEIEVQRWEHATLAELQQANLEIEQGGPESIVLPDTMVQAIRSASVLVVQFAPICGRVLERTDSLRVIGVLRGGTENIDLATATARHICVLNTPGRNARAVAECTVGLIFAELRNIGRAHAQLAGGRWCREFPNSAAIAELAETTIGLVGYGAVGRFVADYLIAFGSRVLAYDPLVSTAPNAVTLVDFPTLLRQADVVSVHARLSADTHHLIGRAELALMKPTAVLVNTARSGLIDETALIDALAARQIMGAALDVFDTEPLPADHPLLKLDNVTLTPHIAGSTIHAFRNSPKLFAGHLRRLLQGASDVPVVNNVWPQFTDT